MIGTKYQNVFFLWILNQRSGRLSTNHTAEEDVVPGGQEDAVRDTHIYFSLQILKLENEVSVMMNKNVDLYFSVHIYLNLF